MNIEELKKINFAFVIARGRSGTTLLRTMLNANTNTISPFESKVIVHVKQRYASEKNWNKQKVLQFIEDLYEDVKFKSFWAIDKEKLTKEILSFPAEQLNLELLLKITYLCFPTEFEKENITLLVDKNPPYAVFLEDLHKIFPDAKYIHLVRDYRDNIQSIKKTNPIKNISVLAHGWLNDNLKIEKFKAKHPHKIHTIRYEDLVSDPENGLKGICKHLGISFQDGMLSFQNKLKSEIDKNTNIQKDHKAFLKYHGNLSKPVNTESINKWKKYLTDKEVEQIEYICKDWGLKYNYLPTLVNGKGSYLKSKFGYIRYEFNAFVMIAYYNLPFWFRHMIRAVTKTLYSKFGYTTVYNRLDYSITNEE
jgi:hypothetical protein